MGRQAGSVWQISSGPRSGSYAETFLRHGVGLVGPGDTGQWRPGKSFEDWRHIESFADEVQVGDVLVLRCGSSEMIDAGIVASHYMYLGQFDDVNGWDLQHARRVRWCQLPVPHDFGSAVFTGSAFGRVQHSDVLQQVRRFLNSPPTEWQMASLPALPDEEPDLIEVPDAVQDIVALACDLGSGLYWNSGVFGPTPSENEMVAHLVVPLLRALGWPQERIALEWYRTDVALFTSLPRCPENCRLIVEAKAVGYGLDDALAQAKDYAAAISVDCDLLVTNGIRYRLHGRDDDYAAVAYANLCRLKKSSTALFDRLARD